MTKTVNNTGWRGSLFGLGGVLALSALLLLAGCSEGVDPPPPTMEGDWTVHNEATGVETLLELDQRGTNLTGFWHRPSSSVRMTGRITPSKEFNLSGQFANNTYSFNAEANDGFARFSGTISVYDARGDRKSLQMVTGRR